MIEGKNMPQTTTGLFQIDNAKYFDPRYFAMLNNAVAVSGNKQLEGGNPGDALAYYHYLLNIKLPNCPLSFNLTDKQATALESGFANIIKLNELLEKSHADGTLHTKEGLNIVIIAIRNNSQATGVSYFPSGYTGDPTGHFAALKIKKLENGHDALPVLNHGEGMQYHRKIVQSGSKDKRSYLSNDYGADLKTDNGRELLQRIIQLRFDPQRKHDTQQAINPYSADDLYGLLKLYGKEIPLTEKLSEKSVTPQRTGTCSVTNVHAIARDILIDNGADFKTRKRYHFVLKLLSLIAGFDAYCKGHYAHNLLEWALREFSVRLNKQYRSILTDEEMIYCGQVQAQIQKRLEQDKQESIQKKCATKPLPNLVGDARQYKQNILNLTKEKTVEKTEEKKSEVSTPRAAIKPEEMKALLNFKDFGWHGNKQNYTFKEIYDVFNSLPHCTGLAKDEFWDKVPEHDIHIILGNLSEFAKQLRSSPWNSPQDRARSFAMALMAYDIAAQLAPRYKEEFYGGFKLGDKYALGLDDVYSEQYFFTDPIAYHTVKRVANNFALRAQNKQRILSNAVNYDEKKHDNTVHYVINVLLTYLQRSAVAQARMKKEKKDSARYTDEELFEYLVQHLDMEYKGDYITRRSQITGGEIHVLDSSVRNLIQIAATAHALGNVTKTYKKKEGRQLWYFADNQFHQEVTREDALKKLEIAKHLPQISQIAAGKQLQDFSENTIYHPQDHLIKLQDELKKYDGTDGNGNERYKYSPTVQHHPYQLYLSGSLKPESTIWQADNSLYKKEMAKELAQLKDLEKRLPYGHPELRALENKIKNWRVKFERAQQLAHEEMNQDFRQIECSPNLQIVRTLAWAASHLDRLSYKVARDRINELLFQYSKLDSAFANQLEATLLNMNHLLSALIKHCKEEVPQDMELLFWASNLAHDLRYHLEVAAKLYKLPISQFTLSSFQELLLSRIKNTQDTSVRSRLASQVIRDFRNASPLSINDICLLLICRMVAHLGDEADSSDEAWQNLQAELQATIKNNESEVTKILTQLLPHYIKLQSVSNWKLVDTKLQAIGVDFLIDLTTGSLQSKETTVLKERTEKTVSDNKELFSRLLLSADNIVLFYSNNSAESLLKSPGGQWEFTYSASYSGDRGSQFTIKSTFQSLNIEGVQSKFKLLNKEELKQYLGKNTNPFESEEYFGTHYQYWQSLADKDLIFVRQENSEFAYCYATKERVISQLCANKSGEWRRNGKLLLNLTEPEKEPEKELRVDHQKIRKKCKN